MLRRRRIYPLTIYDSIRFDPRHSSHSRKLLPLPYPPISFEIALRFIARPSLTASSAFLSIFFFFFSFLSFSNKLDPVDLFSPPYMHFR